MLRRSFCYPRNANWPIYERGLMAVKPENLMNEKIHIRDNYLIVKSLPLNGHKLGETRRFDLHGTKIHIFGAGKASFRMGMTLLRILARTPNPIRSVNGCLSIPKDVQPLCDSRDIATLESLKIKCMFGAKNNQPDEDSVNATNTILDMIEKSKNPKPKWQHLYILLLSGGGSACLCSPRFISLDEKRNLIEFVKTRRDIDDVNKVRRYFSSVKAGRLAKRIIKDNNERAKVITLIISDVIDDPIEFIASGPTYIHNDHQDETAKQKEIMVQVLKDCEYDKLDLLLKKCGPEANYDHLEMELPELRIHNVLLGNNQMHIAASSREASLLGYKVISLGSRINSTCSKFIKQLLEERDKHFATSDQPCMIIGGGEVRLDIWPGDTFGVGGRCQELTMRYMYDVMKDLEKSSSCIYNDKFIAAATDGQDGPTEIGYCTASLYNYVDLEDPPFTRETLQRWLRRHDSWNFWRNHMRTWAYKTRMTGTNVMDVYFGMFVKPSVTDIKKQEENLTAEPNFYKKFLGQT